jgi:phenylacetate-coenzyme A ligase PaaK-like adenylate-forming protein
MNLYPRALESVLLPAYDRVKGREYVRRRRLLDESQWWDAERLRQFQWNELQKLLAHAFASVPFLQEKYKGAGIRLADIRTWSDFRQLPVLTRQEINAHGAALCSTTYKGALLPHATGGSTGTPTRFFRTYESYDWRMAAKDRVYGWSGWRLGERSLYLWGAPVGFVSRPQLWKTRAFEAVHRELIFNTFSQSDALWQRIYDAAIRYRPVLVVGYVSSLEQFSAFLRATKRTIPGLRSVIAAAEPLFSTQRDAIEAAFQAPVFNTYGSREFMSIGGECEVHDGLHVNIENLVVETRDGSVDQPSEILVTDLHNFGMPFIRYATGDLGTVSDDACACGRALPKLNSIEGRVLDALRTADGRTVPGEFFPHLLKEVPELAQYRVEQRTLDHLVISAVLAQPLSRRSQTLLEKEILKVFGPAMKWEVQAVSEIPQLSSGKRRVTVGMGR